MSWRKSRVVAAFGGLVWIAIGWLGAVAWFEVLRPYAQSPASISCVENGACVGQSTDEFLRLYDRDRGGLTGILCNDDWMYLEEIVRGNICPAASYLLEFRNPSASTVVTVDDGLVSKITIGPLHNIDF